MHRLQQFMTTKFDYPKICRFGKANKKRAAIELLEQHLLEATYIVINSASLLKPYISNLVYSTYQKEIDTLHVIANRLLHTTGNRVSNRAFVKQFMRIRSLFYTLAFSVLPLNEIIARKEYGGITLGSGRFDIMLHIEPSQAGNIYTVYYHELKEQNILKCTATPNNQHFYNTLLRYGGIIID